MKTFALAILAMALVGCSKSNNTSISAVPVRFNEQDVRQFVISGRTIAEITNRFGRPSAVMTNNGRVSMWFINPLMASSKAANPFGFSTSFTNGMVEKWEALQIKFDAAK